MKTIPIIILVAYLAYLSGVLVNMVGDTLPERIVTEWNALEVIINFALIAALGYLAGVANKD